MPQHSSHAETRSSRPGAHPAMPGLPGFDQVFPQNQTWQPMLLAMATWNGHLGMTFASIGSEWCDFVQRRLKKDMATTEKVAICRTSDEALKILASHYQKTAEDYREEFMTLARLGSGLAGTNVETAYKCFDYMARGSEPQARSH